MKAKDKIALVTIVFLGLAMAALGAVNSCAVEQKMEGSLEVTVNGESKGILTAEELSAMKASTFKAIIRSSSEGKSEAEFTGVLVLEIVARVYPAIKDGYKAMIVKAEDGYQTVLSKEEVEQKDNAYICFLMDGAPIKPKVKKGQGPLRLIIRKDEFGQRWVKYVDRIEVKK